jgi:hypothetical protein
VARVLIVGGGCRGRGLGRALVGRGEAVRITTRTEAGRAGIERVGGECWIGTPDRIGSLRYALENVTLLCWVLGTAAGGAEAVGELHRSRLEFMLGQTIDTTVRGVIYEAAGTVAPDRLAGGAALVGRWAAFNRVAYRILDHDPVDGAGWLEAGLAAVDGLLGGLGRAGGGE